MDFRNVILQAVGTIENGTRFNRSDIHRTLIKIGYAERTATNACTPSRRGLIGILLEVGAIEKHGPYGYQIIDKSKIKKPDTKRVKHYFGEAKEGWDYRGIMSDSDKHPDVEWLLCGEEYDDDKFNLKLYANGRVPHKANYWMQWTGKTLRGRDALTLKEHHPDIFDNVLDDMKGLA